MVGHGNTQDGLSPEYDPSQPRSATNRREIPSGIGGREVKGVGLDLINDQGAVAVFEKYPGRKGGNVAVVDTRPMYRDESVSPSGFRLPLEPQRHHA